MNPGAQLGDHANARQQYRAVTDEVPSYTIANSSRIGKLFTWRRSSTGYARRDFLT